MKRKVRIEIDPTAEEEVVIRCRELTPEILELRSIAEGGRPGEVQALSLTLNECEYFVPLVELLFFETYDGRTTAHTVGRMYYTDLKLCELIEILPNSFMRVSKSCILNIRAVSGLRRDVTGIGEAFFTGCNKKVSISRMYYKAFRERIVETRLNGVGKNVE